MTSKESMLEVIDAAIAYWLERNIRDRLPHAPEQLQKLRKLKAEFESGELKISSKSE